MTLPLIYWNHGFDCRPGCKSAARGRPRFGTQSLLFLISGSHLLDNLVIHSRLERLRLPALWRHLKAGKVVPWHCLQMVLDLCICSGIQKRGLSSTRLNGGLGKQLLVFSLHCIRLQYLEDLNQLLPCRQVFPQLVLGYRTEVEEVPNPLLLDLRTAASQTWRGWCSIQRAEPVQWAISG